MTGVPPQATPERLTGILRRAGVLEHDEVVDVAVETPRDTLISRVARLRLTYGSAADTGPSHVFFKTQRDGVDQALRELGRKEVALERIMSAVHDLGCLELLD